MRTLSKSIVNDCDQNGLTLVELLVTLAVAAIVLTYAVPSLQTVVANNRQTALVNRFVMSILLARSTAITRHVEVLICPTINGQTCHVENDWSQGWLVMAPPVDAATDAPGTEHQPMHVEFALSNVQLHVNRHQFYFRPGFKRATNGTVVVCVAGATQPKAVIVSYNGRPRTSLKRADGTTLECPTDPN